MIRRLRWLTLLLIVFSGLFPVRAQSSAVTVKLWIHNFEPRETLDKELISQFEAANPGVKVEYVVLAASLFDSRLATALGTGGGPDLFNQWTALIGQFHAAGILAPIDPLAAGYQSVEAIQRAYVKGALAGAMFDGILYGLPSEASNYACFANNSLFWAAGLDPDRDFPRTWEAAITIAAKLTRRDSAGSITQRGFDLPWNGELATLLTFEPMVNQLGGTLIDESVSPPTVHLNTPQVRQVLTYWRDWADVYHLGGPQYPNTIIDFLAGTLAINCYAGNWLIPPLDEARIDYSIHPLPRWAAAVKNVGSDTYIYYWMVNRFSSPEKQAAAWKLAGYLTAFPARYLQEAGLFQPRLDYVSSDGFQRSKQGQQMKIFLDEAMVSHPHARVPGLFEVIDAFDRMIDRVMIGHEALDQVLPQADLEINAILKRAAEDAKR